MNYVTPKYKILECKYIIDNPNEYSKEKYEKAKEIYNEWVEKVNREYNPITEEQRNELKKKYPNLY